MTQEFEASLDEWAAGVRADLTAIARQAAYQLAFQVVTDTPVDTGFLRGNWQPSIGMIPPPKENPPFDPGGGIAMADFAVSIANLTLGDVIHYTNACVYARRIEYGFVGYDSLGRYYNQAGRYYVTNNVAQWDSIVQAKALELGQ